MTKLSELDLTIGQLHDIQDADPEIVQQWLDALDTKTGLKNPAGWFYAGIKTGRPPGQKTDAARAKAVHLAETYIRNASLYNPDEASILDDLFGPFGRLKQWADDETLRDRMADLWQAQQPRAAHAEQDRLARAARHRAMRSIPDLPDKPPVEVPW